MVVDVWVQVVCVCVRERERESERVRERESVCVCEREFVLFLSASLIELQECMPVDDDLVSRSCVKVGA